MYQAYALTLIAFNITLEKNMDDYIFEYLYGL